MIGAGRRKVPSRVSTRKFSAFGRQPAWTARILRARGTHRGSPMQTAGPHKERLKSDTQTQLTGVGIGSD